MKIKNYIVDNIEVVIDYLETILCQQGISYVRIDNEFHFNNQIVRLYDLILHKDIILSWTLSKLEMITPPFHASLSYETYESMDCFISKKVPQYTKQNYQPRNKKNYKQESKQVKQLIKKYSR